MGQPGEVGELGQGVAILDPTASEIAWALLALGGAAHRDTVADHVARERGGQRPTDALRHELDKAFALHCQDATDPRAATLLHLPHGPGSQRWALTEWAHQLLRAARGLGTSVS